MRGPYLLVTAGMTFEQRAAWFGEQGHIAWANRRKRSPKAVKWGPECYWCWKRALRADWGL